MEAPISYGFTPATTYQAVTAKASDNMAGRFNLQLNILVKRLIYFSQ